MKLTYEELERYGRQADITIENLEQKLAESQREFRAADATIENLQMQLNAEREAKLALAAENAGLKEWSPNPHSASMFEAIEKAENLMDDGMPELAMVEAFEILKMKRTPATDAFLAEVRASALPVEIAEIIDSGDLEAILYASGYSEAERYRMALYNFRTSRKGVQS